MTTPLTYPNITPDTFQTLLIKLQARHACTATTVPGSTGDTYLVSGHGVKATATYIPALQTLTV